jgi:hypothetical protein
MYRQVIGGSREQPEQLARKALKLARRSYRRDKVALLKKRPRRRGGCSAITGKSKIAGGQKGALSKPTAAETGRENGEL